MHKRQVIIDHLPFLSHYYRFITRSVKRHPDQAIRVPFSYKMPLSNR